MKIAHLSDLHFSHFVKTPLQFFSKTWIGNANLLLKRGKILQPIESLKFGNFLKQKDVDLVIISGDLSTTSQPQEFKKAKAFIEDLKQTGLKVLQVPGNHDHYTKKAFKKQLFYQYLSNEKTDQIFGDLKQHQVEFHCIQGQQILLLDLASYTPWFTAYGTVSSKILDNLKEALTFADPSKPIYVVGHFPIMKKDYSFSHSLKHADKLFECLNNLPIVTYLHGHDHRFNIAKNEQGNFWQIDAGSLSDLNKGSFCLIDTEKKSYERFLRDNQTFTFGERYER